MKCAFWAFIILILLGGAVFGVWYYKTELTQTDEEFYNLNPTHYCPTYGYRISKQFECPKNWEGRKYYKSYYDFN